MQSGKPETWKLLGNSNAADVDYDRYLRARGNAQLKRDDAANARVSAEAQARAKARPGAPSPRPAPTSTPRPAAPSPQPVQSTRTQRPSTGLSTPASSPRPAPTSSSRPAAAPSPRPTAATAPRPAAPSSLSTGGRRSNSELEGKTFATRATSGGTKYEVRTPTSAELAAARNAGGGETGVQAAVARSSNLMSGPTATPAPATPIAAAVKPATSAATGAIMPRAIGASIICLIFIKFFVFTLKDK